MMNGKEERMKRLKVKHAYYIHAADTLNIQQQAAANETLVKKRQKEKVVEY